MNEDKLNIALSALNDAVTELEKTVSLASSQLQESKINSERLDILKSRYEVLATASNAVAQKLETLAINLNEHKNGTN